MVAALHAAGVPVTRSVPSVDIVVVRASAAQAAAIGAAAQVAEVTPDVAVQLQGADYDPSTDANSMINVDRLVKADRAWSYGVTGEGVDVAVIDSGVTPVAGLAADGQVLNGPDLSFESQSDSTRYLDTFGHGTFMAGLIAGHDDAVGDPNATSSYQGVAPGARIVSVKVADSHGRTDVSQVIAGIDWVVQHAHDPGMNIRVLNLSFGTDSKQSYLVDPLAYAAEVAWRSGIVVVVSSGNKPSDQLSDPAVDPYLIAVGALDTNSTVTKADDSVALFTALGNSKRSIDLVTPGVHVQGLRVPGSYIDLRFGTSGRLGTRFFRGSGTSESAAIASGVVALLLDARPNLTPDQVKRVLTSTGYDPAIGNPYLRRGPQRLQGDVVRVARCGELAALRGVDGDRHAGGIAGHGARDPPGRRGAGRRDGHLRQPGQHVGARQGGGRQVVVGRRELERRDLGGSILGRRELGRSLLGRRELGRSLLGRSLLGRRELGRSLLGRRELGRSLLGRRELGRSLLGRRVLGRRELGRGDLGMIESLSTQHPTPGTSWT